MSQKQLNLIEIFASIQGESHTSGFPTTFIRLAACNLRCVWCDSTYSFGRGTPYALDAIIEQVEKNGCRHICITGGEPLLQQNVHPLMRSLCDAGYFVSIETGGSLDIAPIDKKVTVVLDIKCPGSGMNGKNRWANLEHLKDEDAVKFVLCHEEDYAYADAICRQYNLYKRPTSPLFSPVHGMLDPKTLTEWILRDKLAVRLNLQIHKYIWSPDTIGV